MQLPKAPVPAGLRFHNDELPSFTLGILPARKSVTKVHNYTLDYMNST